MTAWQTTPTFLGSPWRELLISVVTSFLTLIGASYRFGRANGQTQATLDGRLTTIEQDLTAIKADLADYATKTDLASLQSTVDSVHRDVREIRGFILGLKATS